MNTLTAFTPTPGPWNSQVESMSDCSLVVTGDGRTICKLRDSTERDYSEADYRAIADSRLIAAAPELLAAAQAIDDITCKAEGGFAGCGVFLADGKQTLVAVHVDMRLLMNLRAAIRKTNR